MEREKLRQAVKSYAGKSEPFHFKLPEELKKSQIQNAIQKYAKGVRPEDVVALMDTTLFGNGKNGYLMTEHKIYQSSFKVECDLDGIVSCSRKKKSDTLILHYSSGEDQELYMNAYPELEDLFKRIVCGGNSGEAQNAGIQSGHVQKGSEQTDNIEIKKKTMLNPCTVVAKSVEEADRELEAARKYAEEAHRELEAALQRREETCQELESARKRVEEALDVLEEALQLEEEECQKDGIIQKIDEEKWNEIRRRLNREGKVGEILLWQVVPGMVVEDASVGLVVEHTTIKSAKGGPANHLLHVKFFNGKSGTFQYYPSKYVKVRNYTEFPLEERGNRMAQPDAELETKKMQYLGYKNEQYYFIDEDTSEQIVLSEATVADSLIGARKYDQVRITFYGGIPFWATRL